MNRSEIRAGLDTSVLVRLLTGQPADQANTAFEFLAEAEEAGEGILVSNLVVAEAYFACQHHYRLPKAEILRGLMELLSQPTFVVQPALLHILALDAIDAAKPGFLDRLIHAEYAASGVTLATFERSATRLPGTRVLSTAASPKANEDS
jgi:predicted nucleic-acid-binding protein